MAECKSFNENKYRVYESYSGKFYYTTALCDTPDSDTAELVVKVFTEYHKNSPFEYFIRRLDIDVY